MAKKRGIYKDMTPVERSIFSRERGIARMNQNIRRIRDEAAEKIALIQTGIREKQTLVDALKRGTLKP